MVHSLEDAGYCIIMKIRPNFSSSTFTCKILYTFYIFHLFNYLIFAKKSVIRGFLYTKKKQIKLLRALLSLANPFVS